MWQFRYTLVVLFSVFTVTVMAQSQTLYFPPKVGNVWQTTNPTSLGFCQERIDSLYHFLEVHDTKSFILLQDGKIVLEKYFGTFTQDSFWYWASAGKSVTAFLVGQARDEGLVALQTPTSTYLGQGWTSCTPAQEALITVRHQLTMTTGLDDNVPPTPSVPDPDNCTDPTCLVYKAAPGTRWAYHNAPYRLLHDVIENASGKTINQYTKSHLLDPTGMKGLWADHILYGRARDMARFGLLVQAGGIWDGDTLLHDAQYLYDMTHPSQQLNKSYGYLWWLNGQESFMLPSTQLVFPAALLSNAPPDLFAALGKNDQKVHVVPSKGWVVIRQGNSAGYTNQFGNEVPIYFDNDLWLYLNQLVCAPTGTVTVDPGSQVTARPNPAETSWTVTFPAPPTSLQLMDATGRQYSLEAAPQETNVLIPAANLPAGVFFLNGVCDGRLVSIKLVRL